MWFGHEICNGERSGNVKTKHFIQINQQTLCIIAQAWNSELERMKISLEISLEKAFLSSHRSEGFKLSSGEESSWTISRECSLQAFNLKRKVSHLLWWAAVEARKRLKWKIILKKEKKKFITERREKKNCWKERKENLDEDENTNSDETYSNWITLVNWFLAESSGKLSTIEIIQSATCRRGEVLKGK